MTNDLTSEDSVRFKGVTKRIRAFLWKFPQSNAKEICRTLDLPYKKYRQLVWNEKTKLKKALSGELYGRVHAAHVEVVHREEWRTPEPLGVGVVEAVRFEALKRVPLPDQSKPFDEWYVAPNRNRVMILRNDWIQIRVWPKSRSCRVLPRRKMDWETLKVTVQNAFFKAGLDVNVCEFISEGLEPQSRHRVFKVGPVTPFKIDFYKPSLGITILADGSHPEYIEVPEDWPTWIKPQLSAIARQTDVISKLTEQLSLHLKVMEGIRVVSEEQKSTTEKLTSTAQKLTEAVEKLTETLRKPKRPRQPRQPRPKKRRFRLFARFGRWIGGIWQSPHLPIRQKAV